MKYIKPEIYRIFPHNFIESACLDGNMASAPKSCDKGFNADSSCTQGVSATYRCTIGSAPGQKCENGVGV